MKMSDIQQSQLSITSLNDKQFQQVVQYLDPKSITQLVLVSRTIRFKVGHILFWAILKQYEYKQKQTQPYNILCGFFKQIDDVLEQFPSTFTLDHYSKMVLQFKQNNINFFQTLYSLILNKQINLSSQEFYQQKKALIQLGPNILQAFEQMRITQILPSINFDETTLKINPLSQQFNGQKNNKFFTIICSFIESLIKMKSSGKGTQDYKQYKQLQNYFKNTNLKQSKKIGIYQNKIYYTSKKMLDVLNKNTIQLIFQFLLPQDILKMRLLNKWFYHSIPSFMQTSITFMKINVEQLQQDLDNFDPILIDLINKNQQLEIHRSHIHELMAFINPPQCILDICNLLLQINCLNNKYTGDTNGFMQFQRYNSSITNIISDTTQIYNDRFYKEFSEEQMQRIEKYLEQNTFERMMQYSYAMSRVYLNIQINHFLNKTKTSEELYSCAIKTMIKVKRYPKYLSRYEQMYNKLISKQQQLNLNV